MSSTQTLEVRDRKTRADAVRNRELILAAAKECFADETTVYGMPEIAARAGVGVGSIYRAFGNRAGLAEAVFRDMIDELVQVASELRRSPSAWSALRRWLDAYVDGLLSKLTIIRELQPVFDADPHVAEDAHRIAAEALALVLARTQAAGLVRPDLEPSDILPVVNGIVRAWPGDRKRIGKMLDVVLSGLRVAEA